MISKILQDNLIRVFTRYYINMDLDNLIPSMERSHTVTDSLSVIITTNHPSYRETDSVNEKTQMICDTA